MIKVAFTGHRPHDLYGYKENVEGNIVIKKWLMQKICTVAKKYPSAHFISGGALGIDTWAAECVLEAKKTFPNITLEIAVPCIGQESKWSKEQQQRYHRILEQADKVTYVSDRPYTPYCMQDRNEYMVDEADAIIGVWSGKPYGGTYNCLKYAEEKERPMLLLHPFDFVQRKVKTGEKLFS